MKKLILFPLLLLVINSAHAVDLRQYIAIKATNLLSSKSKIDMPYSNISVDMQEAFGIKGAFGVKLHDFRTELEAGVYTNAKSDDKRFDELKISHTILTISEYYDISTNSPFTPYIGVGLGYNRITVKTNDMSDNDYGFVWRIGGGFSWSIQDRISLDLAYNYVDFGTYNGREFDASLVGHEITFGTRFTF